MSKTHVLQSQAYEHVLKDEGLERDAVESLVEYIARNPERKGCVSMHSPNIQIPAV